MWALGILVEILILIIKIVVGFLAVILIMSAPGILMDWVSDRRTKKVISEYCSKHDFMIEKIEIHKNHCGLTYSKNGLKNYVRFRVKRKNEIEWVGKVPEEISNNA